MTVLEGRGSTRSSVSASSTDKFKCEYILPSDLKVTLKHLAGQSAKLLHLHLYQRSARGGTTNSFVDYPRSSTNVLEFRYWQ